MSHSWSNLSVSLPSAVDIEAGIGGGLVPAGILRSRQHQFSLSQAVSLFKNRTHIFRLSAWYRYISATLTVMFYGACF